MNLLFFSTYYLPHLSGITEYPHRVLSQLAKTHSIRVLTFAHQKNIPFNETIDGIQIIRLPFWFRFSKGFIAPLSIISSRTHLNWADRLILNLPSLESLPLSLYAIYTHKTVLSFFHCDVHLGSLSYDWFIETILRKVVQFQLQHSTKIMVTTLDYVKSLPWYSSKFLSKTTVQLPPLPSMLVNSNRLQQFQLEKKSRIWVGYVGRFAREKGLEYLIQAISQISSPSKTTLVIAGPSVDEVVGEKSYYRQIQKLLAKTKISYHHYGKLNRADLNAFYKSLDVLVVPSINQTESLNLAQLEALSLGVPVIVTNLPGVRVPVQLTRHGIIINPRDTHALAAAIKSLPIKSPVKPITYQSDYDTFFTQ